MESNLSVTELLWQAETLRRGADLKQAKEIAAQAEVMARQANNLIQMSRSLTVLSHIAHDLRESELSLSYAINAIQISETIADDLSTAQAHSVAARILLSIRDTDNALAHSVKSLEAAERCGEKDAYFFALYASVPVYAELQQWSNALDYCHKLLALAESAADAFIELKALTHFSFIYGQMSIRALADKNEKQFIDLTNQSITASKKALVMCRQTTDRRGEVTCLLNLAEAQSQLGQHVQALALIDSLVLNPERDTKLSFCQRCETRGLVLQALGRLNEARDEFIKAVELATGTISEFSARSMLASVLEEIADYRGALEQQKRALKVFQEHNSETARRTASIAAVRYQTLQAEKRAHEFQNQADQLIKSNEHMNRRSEDLERQAFEDALTSLPNRRRLDQLLQEDYRILSVVLLDVDHFKQVNDRFSHLVGDTVLSTLAQLLRESCRGDDMALRYGGEEFVLVLRHTSMQGLLTTAERTRTSIAAYNWDRLAPGLKITASFGVAQGGEVNSSKQLIALADQRLYAAKQAGRNQVVGRLETVSPEHMIA
jgi:diguanylate cyclase (GGDEF)-like protein